MRVVAITHPTDTYAAELIRVLVSADTEFVVIDVGSDETERGDTYSDAVLAAGSIVRHVGGSKCELLDLTVESLDAVLAAGSAVMGGVDTVIVGADESWARLVLEPGNLDRLARRGVAQVAVLEAPDSGWERAQDVWESASGACKALAVRPTTSSRRPASPLERLFANAQWSAMSQRDLREAIARARTARNDVLAGTHWSPKAQFLFEGWVCRVRPPNR